MLLRPLWPGARPEELKDWDPLADDLLTFLEERDETPIGVGHSFGAIVTLMAALRAPRRFRALVLLDPVLFPPWFIVVWNLVRWMGIGRRIHPRIPAALKRRRKFNDLEQPFRGYRMRPIFRYLSNTALRTYIAGITRPKAEGGYELAYSPEWEAQIYYTGVWRDLRLWRQIKDLDVPTLVIRGAESDTFWEPATRLLKRNQPNIRLETIEKSTHLFPLERPGEVFDSMQDFLKKC